MNAVAIMLNLADGIFGAIANIRIVCTTNADKLAIDPALLRAGRLCANIEVPALAAAHAASVCTRLCGQHHSFPASTRLADVYKVAEMSSRGRSNFSFKGTDAPMGFSRRSE